MINISIINKDTIDKYIERYNIEYGKGDDVLTSLFQKVEADRYEDVFCRVGLLDSIYGTGIQRYNKGGVTAVANHIFANRQAIADRVNNTKIDYDLFELIAKVDYSSVKNIDDNKNMNRIDSFATKYLSFCNPDTYPIMDRMVKMAIGVSEDTRYERFCERFFEFKMIFEKLDKQYSLKQIDSFLWLCGKDYIKNGSLTNVV